MVFPHNFDFEQHDTRELLSSYLDPVNPQATVHPDDLQDFEGNDDQTRAFDMLRTLQDAALQGFDYAPNVDHDQGKDEGTKKDNIEWNDNWETFLKKFELPVVKGAVALGYRVAKRAELKKEGRLREFVVCEHDDKDVSGCLTNQYREDASRHAISNFFGRNKNATRFMSRMPSWCRKHYQKEAYSDENWQKYKRHLINATIDRNEASANKDGKQDLTYEIKLRNWDELRIIEVATGKGNGAPPKGNKHPADLIVIQHIHRQFCGKNKTAAEAKQLTHYAQCEYEQKVATWKAGKDEKQIRKDMKQKGPKYCEFQLIPEWDQLYTAAEIEAKEPSTPRKEKDEGKPRGPVSNTPKRARPEKEEKKDGPQTPSKKPRKK